MPKPYFEGPPPSNPYENLEKECFLMRETEWVLLEGRAVTVKFGFIGSDKPCTVCLKVYENKMVMGYWSSMSAIVTALDRGKKVVKTTYPNGHVERTTRHKTPSGMYLLTSKRKEGSRYYPTYSMDETLITVKEWDWMMRAMHAWMVEHDRMWPGNPCFQKDFTGLWFEQPKED